MGLALGDNVGAASGDAEGLPLGALMGSLTEDVDELGLGASVMITIVGDRLVGGTVKMLVGASVSIRELVAGAPVKKSDGETVYLVDEVGWSEKGLGAIGSSGFMMMATAAAVAPIAISSTTSPSIAHLVVCLFHQPGLG